MITCAYFAYGKNICTRPRKNCWWLHVTPNLEKRKIEIKRLQAGYIFGSVRGSEFVREGSWGGKKIRKANTSITTLLQFLATFMLSLAYFSHLYINQEYFCTKRLSIMGGYYHYYCQKIPSVSLLVELLLLSTIIRLLHLLLLLLLILSYCYLSLLICQVIVPTPKRFYFLFTVSIFPSSIYMSYTKTTTLRNQTLFQ